MTSPPHLVGGPGEYEVSPACNHLISCQSSYFLLKPGQIQKGDNKSVKRKCSSVTCISITGHWKVCLSHLTMSFPADQPREYTFSSLQKCDMSFIYSKRLSNICMFCMFCIAPALSLTFSHIFVYHLMYVFDDYFRCYTSSKYA